VFIEELVLGKMIICVLSDLYLLSILPLPFPYFGPEYSALGEIGI
jgi:hypothetical protein